MRSMNLLTDNHHREGVRQASLGVKGESILERRQCLTEIPGGSNSKEEVQKQ